MQIFRNYLYIYMENVKTFGTGPSARESHAGVMFEKDGYRKLIIHGGMDGCRLNDLWILDLNSMTWSNPQPEGIPPLPRSLHSANIIGDRLFFLLLFF